ncbi:hypothetical protein B0H11DRAFT_2435665 [Mycena galericulata]|nr:hypothetical protein B0H11DRAFT_2435665 [Mycena galericulata]
MCVAGVCDGVKVLGNGRTGTGEYLEKGQIQPKQSTHKLTRTSQLFHVRFEEKRQRGEKNDRHNPCTFPPPISSITEGITCTTRAFYVDTLPPSYPYFVSKSSSAKNFQIPFFLFSGPDPPPADIGCLGDVYVAPEASALYGYLPVDEAAGGGGWVRWTAINVGCEQRLLLKFSDSGMLGHPYFPERILWARKMDISWYALGSINAARREMCNEKLPMVNEDAETATKKWVARAVQNVGEKDSKKRRADDDKDPRKRARVSSTPARSKSIFVPRGISTASQEPARTGCDGFYGKDQLAALLTAIARLEGETEALKTTLSDEEGKRIHDQTTAIARMEREIEALADEERKLIQDQTATIARLKTENEALKRSWRTDEDQQKVSAAQPRPLHPDLLGIMREAFACEVMLKCNAQRIDAETAAADASAQVETLNAALKAATTEAAEIDRIKTAAAEDAVAASKLPVVYISVVPNTTAPQEVQIPPSANESSQAASLQRGLIEQLKTELKQGRQELTKARTTAAKKIEELESEIDEWQKAADQTHAELVKARREPALLKARLTKAEKKIAASELKINRAKQDAARAKDERAELLQERIKVEAAAEDAKAEVTTLNAALEAVKAKSVDETDRRSLREASQATAALQSGTIKQLKTELAQAKQELAAARATPAAIKLAELESQVDDFRRAAEAAQAELVKVRREPALLKAELQAEMARKISSSEIFLLTRHLHTQADLDSVKNAAEHNAAALEKTITLQESEIQSLREQATESDTITQLKAELAQARQELAEAQASPMQAKIAILEQEVDRAFPAADDHPVNKALSQAQVEHLAARREAFLQIGQLITEAQKRITALNEELNRAKQDATRVEAELSQAREDAELKHAEHVKALGAAAAKITALALAMDRAKDDAAAELRAELEPGARALQYLLPPSDTTTARETAAQLSALDEACMVANEKITALESENGRLKSAAADDAAALKLAGVNIAEAQSMIITLEKEIRRLKHTPQQETDVLNELLGLTEPAESNLQ